MTMTKEELKKYLIEEAEYKESRVNDMDAYELFDKYLQWNGIIGYTEDIIDAFKGAFEDEILLDCTED